MYKKFAKVYDVFMEAVPYEQWADYIDDALGRYNVPKDGLLLDLACGTGSMAFLMAQKGYDIIGVDASVDMLSEAHCKMQESGGSLLFINQDMLKLDLYGTVDAAYSTCDSLNYLLTEEDFKKALNNVAMFLNPVGGVFIFDLKTDKKYRKLGSKTYYDRANTKPSDDIFYIWKNRYDPNTGINEYKVRFFCGGKRSFTEIHRQRGWRYEEVVSLVKKAGLRVLSAEDNYTRNPAMPDSERVTYTCQKLP